LGERSNNFLTSARVGDLVTEDPQFKRVQCMARLDKLIDELPVQPPVTAS
jgi:hypothetical protein